MERKLSQIFHKPFASRFGLTLIKSIIVGLLTGFIVSVFRLIIDHTLQFLYVIYPQMAHNPILIVPYAIVMVGITFILGKVMGKYMDNLTGSGVPQVEAAFLNENKMPWWSILWRKFVGGLLAICPGLMLGREGPCIEMGAMIGKGMGETLNLDDDEKIMLQESGVAAGLTAAFSAPLAGTFFLVEEITFNFKPKRVVSALAASFAADYVTVLFFGLKPCLYLPLKSSFPLKDYWMLPIIGIILGLLAFLYQYCLLGLKPLFAKITILPSKYHSIIPFLLIIPIGLWNAKMLGGSHYLIISLFGSDFNAKLTSGTLTFVLVPLALFAVRFILSMASYGASVPGGIFMPILVLGAMLGVAFAEVFIHLNVLDPSLFTNIIVISMAAYFGAIEKAPFTAIILLTEMVGTVEQILPIVITTFISYFILDWIGGRPIYAALRLQSYPK